MRRSAFVIASIVLAAVSISLAGPVDDPMGYFNVYSLGDIGSPSAKYHSDFQGVCGAAGDVYFSSFSLSLPGHASSTGYTLHTGGSATLTGAYHGSLEIGHNAHLGGLSVAGSVVAGGDIISFSGGQIAGDAIAGGAVALSGAMTVHGDKVSGAVFEPAVNHAALSAHLLATSAEIGAMPDTAVITDRWGGLSMVAHSGVNVVSIEGAALKRAWGFSIAAPADAVVYINVLGETVNLDWTGWSYVGGITPDDVLVNMPEATTLGLTSANAANILAPRALATFPAGLVTGALIVGDLQGGGQVNLGSFSHGWPVPEPATVLLLTAGAAVLLSRRR